METTRLPLGNGKVDLVLQICHHITWESGFSLDFQVNLTHSLLQQHWTKKIMIILLAKHLSRTQIVASNLWLCLASLA